jgi:hypothetical protein
VKPSDSVSGLQSRDVGTNITLRIERQTATEVAIMKMEVVDAGIMEQSIQQDAV